MGTLVPVKKVENLLIIDFETTGIDPKVNQAIELGAIIVDKDTLSIKDDYHASITFDPEEYVWTYGAQRVHGVKKRDQEQAGKPMNQVGNEIGQLIYKYFGGDRVTLCGHNPGFDRSFLEQVLASAGIQVDFHFKMVDTSSIGFALYNASKSDDLFKLMGIERKEHSAWEDANACLSVLKSARQIAQPKGLALLGGK